MSRLDELHEKIIKKYHQRTSIINILHIFKDYLSNSFYILFKFGWRRWYNFWFTKLFIVDEGGEFDLLSTHYKKSPHALKSPSKIEIEHTTICNKKCVFCSHNYPHQDIKQMQMSYENYTKIVDDIPSLKWINIAGIGSFFLHKDAMKMLEYVSNKNLNVNFVDEFDFFTEDHSRRVIELGVNSIYISFDGSNKDTYESIKKGCDFDKALANIKTLLRLKKEMKSPFPVIHFRFIVNKNNYREMPEYIEMISSLENRGTRARVEFIGLIMFPGIEQYYISIEDIPEDIIAETYEKALKHNINLHFSHVTGALPSMTNCTKWTEPFVLVTGDVIQCCAVLMQTNRNFLVENSFGNVFENSFQEIWNSERYKNFRKQVVTANDKVPLICKDCCAYDTSERGVKFGLSD